MVTGSAAVGATRAMEADVRLNRPGAMGADRERHLLRGAGTNEKRYGVGMLPGVKGARRQRSLTFTSGAAAMGLTRGKAGARKQEDLEERWWVYQQGDEYLTFCTLATSLQNMPPAEELAEHRWDFELLMHLLYRLGVVMGVDHCSKAYRSHYSPDVQLSGYLYSTLLTAFTLLPSYVLNGQDFTVSDTVLDQCRSLQAVFLETCQELRRLFDSLQPYSLDHIRSDVRRSLLYFDRNWCRFEMPALEEIEAIHRQACRPLIEAIEVERLLSECELGTCMTSLAPGGGATAALGPGSLPGGRRRPAEIQRARLLDKICELNRLANVEGHGRSDMDIACLHEAERIGARSLCAHLARLPDAAGQPTALSQAVAGQPHGSVGSSAVPTIGPAHGAKRLAAGVLAAEAGIGVEAMTLGACRCAGLGSSSCVSPVLQRVAQSLLRSFQRIRRVLKRYARCLYQLNSHLANNTDLVRALELFEAAWETADRYLVQPGPRRSALSAYSIIAGIREKGFQEALTSLDPGVLVASVPRALLFHDMQRAAITGRADAAAGPTGEGTKGKRLPPKAAQHGAAASTSALPRQGDDVAPLPSSALQRSPLARAFLPREVEGIYNETVLLMGRLTEGELGKIQGQLLSPPEESRTPAVATAGRRLASGRVGVASSSCGGRATAERPPQTPCPPRMAVPNSSRPPTTNVVMCGGLAEGAGRLLLAGKAKPPPEPPAQEESDDEDDEEEGAALALDLSGLQESIEAASGSRLPSAMAPPLSRLAGERDERDVQQLVASTSTLAVHLQRAKPQEWNELIQVVLQGLIFARGSTGRGLGGSSKA